jgi:acyl-homoserine-lactone acylase
MTIYRNKLTLAVALVCCMSLHAAGGWVAGNEILWDAYGVPHIYARDMKQLYYEFGWAQMHNHADLLLRLYGQARGRAAEYWGERYLSTDRQVRLFRVPELAAKAYAGQDPVFRPWLDAFARGINDYAAAHPEAIDREERQVLPVHAEDVIAHGIRVMYLSFLAGEELGIASRKGKAGSNGCAIGAARSASGHAMLLTNPHLPWGDLYTFFEAQL